MLANIIITFAYKVGDLIIFYVIGCLSVASNVTFCIFVKYRVCEILLGYNAGC